METRTINNGFKVASVSDIKRVPGTNKWEFSVRTDMGVDIPLCYRSNRKAKEAHENFSNCVEEN